MNNPPDYEKRRWQTEKSSPLSRLVAYAQVKYDAARTSATVQVLATTRDPKLSLTYVFNGVKQENATFRVDSSFSGTLKISVLGSDGSKLELEEVFFLWNNPAVDQPPQMLSGQKGAIVEMFGWPYLDIAKECPTLGQLGYMGVKVFPPQESVLSFDQPQSNLLNPWYW